MRKSDLLVCIAEYELNPQDIIEESMQGWENMSTLHIAGQSSLPTEASQQFVQELKALCTADADIVDDYAVVCKFLANFYTVSQLENSPLFSLFTRIIAIVFAMTEEKKGRLGAGVEPADGMIALFIEMTPLHWARSFFAPHLKTCYEANKLTRDVFDLIKMHPNACAVFRMLNEVPIIFLANSEFVFTDEDFAFLKSHFHPEAATALLGVLTLSRLKTTETRQMIQRMSFHQIESCVDVYNILSIDFVLNHLNQEFFSLLASINDLTKLMTLGLWLKILKENRLLTQSNAYAFLHSNNAWLLTQQVLDILKLYVKEEKDLGMISSQSVLNELFECSYRDHPEASAKRYLGKLSKYFSKVLELQNENLEFVNRVSIVLTMNEVSSIAPDELRKLRQQISAFGEKECALDAEFKALVQPPIHNSRAQFLLEKRSSFWNRINPRFICPISLHVMDEPVYHTLTTDSGVMVRQYFDRKNLARWLANPEHGFLCPVTRQPIFVSNLSFDEALDDEIGQLVSVAELAAAKYDQRQANKSQVSEVVSLAGLFSGRFEEVVDQDAETTPHPSI